MLEQLTTVVIPALIGAAGAGIPLYISLRKAVSEIKESKMKLDADMSERKTKAETAHRIDTEAEWKRVIDEKNGELIRLRAKDDDQEKKLDDLMDKHIECQKTEARNDERLKNYEKITSEQARQIKALTTKLLQLDKLVRGPNASINQSGSGSHESLFSLDGNQEETPGSGLGEGVRAAGSATMLPSGKAEGSND